MIKQVTSVALLFIAGFLQAQEEKSSFSLYEAQSYALEHAEAVKNAQLDIEAANQKVVETRAIGLPQVNMEAGFQNFLNLPVQVVDGAFIGQPGTTVSFRAGTEYNASAGLSVNQLIFDGSYIVGLQVSRLYKDFSVAAAEVSEEEVLYNVTNAYQMALIAQKNLGFVDSLVDATQKLFDQQKNYYELGMMQKEDLDQLEFSLLNAKTSFENAQNQMKTSMDLLKMTMAFPLDQNIELTDDLSVLVNQSFALSADLGSIENNLNLQMLERQKTLNEYNVKNMKAANLPSFGAFFNQQYNAYTNEFDLFASDQPYYGQTVWGLKLTIPVFSSGSRSAKTKQAIIEVKKAENEIDQLKRQLEFQEMKLRNDFYNAKRMLELQEKNVQLAKSIYENALAKKEIGEGNSIIVSQKYSQLINAQTQYVSALVNVLNARLEIDKLYHKIVK
ncbi:Outer membrane protein TolC [Lishizhenia tianjinensis]|uniref:Outer membrane protein TolC n=1 Tax=Lishizhenia tianjinensis TaxID=477690 RepID=A0A1I6ZSA3_9FLAO|nr:TolC family protein [Lishizhenia tianjinensis]SFT65603.1 Outer membrane protein TolC [Lishizhenia tianjinensis]